MRTHDFYQCSFSSARARTSHRIGSALLGVLGVTGCSFTLDLEERVCTIDAHCSLDGASVCVEGLCTAPDAAGDTSRGDSTGSGDTSGNPGASASSTVSAETSSSAHDDSTSEEESTTGEPSESSGSTSSSSSSGTTIGQDDTSDGCADGDCSSSDTTGEDSSTGTDASESSGGPEVIPGLVVNGDFETNTVGWGRTDPSSLTTLTLSTEQAHGGTQSLLVTNRALNWHGAMVNVTQRIREGVTYRVSAWVRVRNEVDGTDMSMTARLTCLGQAEAYDWLGSTVAWNGDWSEMVGTFIIEEGCRPTEVQIYFEGATVGSPPDAEYFDYYIDDVTAEPVL